VQLSADETHRSDTSQLNRSDTMKSTSFKTTLSILALGVMGLATGGAQAGWGYDRGFNHGPDFNQSRMFSQQIDERQERQMERIQAGFHNGKLTRPEFRELMREQREIRHMERTFSADGRIDAREFARLDRALDEASRNIKDEKHDRQTRYGYNDYRPWHN
jgi:CRISPR/Cas system-associated endoribonuclease Cas2